MELTLFTFVMGVLSGVIGTAAYVTVFMKVPVPRIGFGKIGLFALAFVVVSVVVGADVLPVAAQATQVPLSIPVNDIFSETNNWMATFAPVAAIGIGIAVALAILGYLGKMIISAFKS